MSNGKRSKPTPEEQIVPMPLKWPDKVDLPTTYANHLFISHAGPEFFLIFGEVTTPLRTQVTPDDLKALGPLEVKPVAKIAVSREAMPAIAEVIQENVGRFLAKKAKGEQQEGV